MVIPDKNRLRALQPITIRGGDRSQAHPTGDRIVFDAVTLRAFRLGYITNLIYELTDQTRESTRRLTPDAVVRLAWQELQNKYEVYNLVKHVQDLLKLGEVFHS
jgi:hypothetical protein